MLVIINIFYLIIIQNFDYNFKNRLEALNFDSPDYDLLVIGNSLAMDGVDTELLSRNGFKSYNLSIGGASLMTNYIQLQEYLTMYKYKPDYIILGLGSYMSSFEDEDVHPIVDFTRIDKKFTIDDIPVLKFKWIFKELLKQIVSKEHRDAYLKDGQLKFRKIVYDETRINENLEFAIDKYLSSELITSILKLCTDNNITLIILEMPGFKSVRHLTKIGPFVLDNNNCNGIFLDYNNIEFSKVFCDETDWIGNSHLNEEGARKFSLLLLDDLNKIHQERAAFCRIDDI